MNGMMTNNTTKTLDFGDVKERLSQCGVPGIWSTTEDGSLYQTIGEKSSTLFWNSETKEVSFEGHPDLEQKFKSSEIFENEQSRWDRPDKILDGLYLGSADASQNLEVLKKRNITHILTVGIGLKLYFPSEFQYKHIEVFDYEQADLFSHFESSTQFVDQGRTKGGGVLIHCAAGISRSPTLTIAYLMRTFNWSYQKASNFVLSKRWVSPNNGFVRQLLKYEKELRAQGKELQD